MAGRGRNGFEDDDVNPFANQDILLDLVIKGTEISITYWFFRIKLIDCISHFIYLFPDIAQDMTGHLLNMLHDTDYRVRLYLARKIVVLFQTWEGHNELFNDVCSNIGVQMVQFSNKIPVKSKEVLAVGPQSVPVIETALITLAHLSVHSEEVEVECAFMISAVAAIEPSQRELAYALFDSISRKLSYASRTKYLDQLIGPILFRWVACEVSLVSLLEVQEMFGFNSAKPKNFIEHVCSWLLPFLILRGDAADLNWISKVLLQPLSAVIKGYFVPIFGLSIAARCGTGPEKDLAETVLYESVLQFGEISELERDDLSRKHMLCGSYGLQQKGDEHLARRSSSRRKRSAPGRGRGPACTGGYLSSSSTSGRRPSSRSNLARICLGRRCRGRRSCWDQRRSYLGRRWRAQGEGEGGGGW